MAWAKCQCGRTMRPHGSCYAVEIGTESRMHARIPHDGDHDCHDCNVAPGKLHHLGCDMARCPVCGGQESFCDCVLDRVSILVEASRN